MTEITYDVVEVSVAGYSTVMGALADGKISITNSQDTRDIEVEKSWANADGTDTWPAGVEVEIQLTADGEEVEGKTLTLNAENPSDTFEDLPTHKNVNGTMTEIVYSVEELDVAGYSSSVGALNDGKITITNSQDTTSIEVSKTWENADGSTDWPEDVTVVVQLTRF